MHFKVIFRVKNIVFQNPNTHFCIIRGTLLKHESSDSRIGNEMTIQGIIPAPYKGDIYEGAVSFSIHAKYGYLLTLESIPSPKYPQIHSAVVSFFSKKIKGVGPKKAKEIVETFGVDAIQLLQEDASLLKQLKFSDKKIAFIQEQLTVHNEYQELLEFLHSIQLESFNAPAIYDALKTRIVQRIKSNPYLICSVDKLSFREADRIAHALGLSPFLASRYREALLYYFEYRANHYGDICVPSKTLEADFATGAFLNRVSPYPEGNEVDADTLAIYLNEHLEHRLILKEKNKKGEVFYYLPLYHTMEQQLLSELQRFIEKQLPPLVNDIDVQAYIEDFEQQVFRLADKQKEALFTGLSQSICIMGGGPGTGKTQTTNGLVQCIKKYNPQATIRLMAPTARAAKRMTQLTGLPATTIHRGYGLSGYGKTGDAVLLEDDFLIVDEFSMADIFLALVILKNAAPNTRIFIVGDYNQLPSVGPGAVLRDLINSHVIPYVELNEVFRQNGFSQIVENAHKIIKGFTLDSGVTFDNTRTDSYFIDRTDAYTIQETILETIRRFMKKGYALDDIMVLSPMRVGALGIDELNRLIQLSFNPQPEERSFIRNNGSKLSVNDKVMHILNNDELDVYNGDVGVIEAIYQKEGENGFDMCIAVQYPDKEDVVEYIGADIKELVLAYAISIHKSQGSEADITIMPIHMSQISMWDRNLFYTGYTRTKVTSILIGDRVVLEQALRTIRTDYRHSLICEKLQKNNKVLSL